MQIYLMDFVDFYFLLKKIQAKHGEGEALCVLLFPYAIQKKH